MNTQNTQNEFQNSKVFKIKLILSNFFLLKFAGIILLTLQICFNTFLHFVLCKVNEVNVP